MSIATYDLASLTYDSATTSYDDIGVGLTNKPVVGVFIAFNDAPYVAEPAWTEITEYVRDVNVKRGRQDDLQNFASGSANLTLDNRTRLFDPFNAAQVQRTNLVANPSFETDLSTWSTSGTVARTTAETYIGVASASLTYAGSGTVLIQQSTRSPVTAGLAYTASFYLKQSVDAGSVVSNFMWYNSAGAIILDDTHVFNNPNTAWQRFSQTRTAPTNAVSCSLRIYQTSGEGGGAVATVNYVDAVLFEQSSTVNDYFDGSTYPNGAINVGLTAWTGTANASTSTLVNFPNTNYLKPRRQIKIVGQYNSITYPIFRGYIAGFPVGYTDGGKDSTVQIDCFDALGLLGAETTSNDWAQYYTLAANPTLYWRCNDSEGSTVIRESITGLSARTLEANNGGVPRLYEPLFREVPPLANGLLSNAAQVQRYMYENNGAPNRFHSPNPRLIFWMQGGGGTLTLTYLGLGIIFSISAAGAFTVFGASNNQVLGVYQNGTSNVTVSEFPFHVAIEFSDQNGNEITSLRINDTLQTFTSSSTTPASNSLGDSLDIRFAAFQEIAFYDNGLTAAQVTEIYQAGIGRITESSIDRFNLLTTLTDFPAALTSFAATTVSSVSELTSTQYLLNELQTVTDGEAGELYVTSSGVLKFVARNWFATSTRSNTSQVSFVDIGTGVFYDYASLNMAYDADLVRNDVTVSFTGNGNVNTANATSVSSYGSASENLTTYLATRAEAQTLADYLVTIYKNPKLRIDPFLVKGQRNPTYDWQRLLALELLDRFTFVRTPSVGSAISQDMLLQSIEHRITPNTWETVVNGSARFTGWFIIGTSLIGGTDVLL